MIFYWDTYWILHMIWAMVQVCMGERIIGYHLNWIQKGTVCIVMSTASMIAVMYPQYHRFFLFFIETGILFVLIRNIEGIFEIFASNVLAGGMFKIAPYPFWLIIYGSFCLLYLTIQYIQKRDIYTVVLKHHGRKIRLRALYDTGNALYLPGSEIGVSIIPYANLEPFICWEELYGLQRISYSSVGKTNGSLMVFPMEELIILEKNKKIKHPYIGIVYHPLSQTGKYEMILHRDVFH